MKLSSLKMGATHAVDAQASPAYLAQMVQHIAAHKVPEIITILNALRGAIQQSKLATNPALKSAVKEFYKDILSGEVSAPPAAFVPQTPDAINVRCVDFTLRASPGGFSARKLDPMQGNDVAHSGNGWGARSKAMAWKWIVANQEAVVKMDFEEFGTAIQKATGKYPDVYDSMN